MYSWRVWPHGPLLVSDQVRYDASRRTATPRTAFHGDIRLNMAVINWTYSFCRKVRALNELKSVISASPKLPSSFFTKRPSIGPLSDRLWSGVGKGSSTRARRAIRQRAGEPPLQVHRARARGPGRAGTEPTSRRSPAEPPLFQSRMTQHPRATVVPDLRQKKKWP